MASASTNSQPANHRPAVIRQTNAPTEGAAAILRMLPAWIISGVLHIVIIGMFFLVTVGIGAADKHHIGRIIGNNGFPVMLIRRVGEGQINDGFAAGPQQVHEFAELLQVGVAERHRVAGHLAGRLHVLDARHVVEGERHLGRVQHLKRKNPDTLAPIMQA